VQAWRRLQSLELDVDFCRKNLTWTPFVQAWRRLQTLELDVDFSRTNSKQTSLKRSWRTLQSYSYLCIPSLLTLHSFYTSHSSLKQIHPPTNSQIALQIHKKLIVSVKTFEIVINVSLKVCKLIRWSHEKNRALSTQPKSFTLN
jgi:hypothetical protein